MEFSGFSVRSAYCCYAYPPFFLSRKNSLLGEVRLGEVRLETLLESLLPTVHYSTSISNAAAMYVCIPAYSLSKVFKWEKRWEVRSNG